MKYYLMIAGVIAMAASLSAQGDGSEYNKPIHPGEPGTRPFWTVNSKRFIYPPTFDFPRVDGANKYRFTLENAKGTSQTFIANQPWDSPAPVWEKIPEGLTTLTVTGVDSNGRKIGVSGQRVFYRSPGFKAAFVHPASQYQAAGASALKAIYEAPHVQYWLTYHKPDPDYARYCYPNKIIGGLTRAMARYSRVASSEQDRKSALEIARAAADYMISLNLPDNYHFAHIPPTYTTRSLNKPLRVAVDRASKHWFMVPSAVDSALAFLDLYDATKDKRYLDQAVAMADTLKKTQESDGTWPLMAKEKTGKPVHPQRMIPTWVIFFFDRLENQYGIEDYKKSREIAWNWILEHPLKTYQWDGQFEDVKPRDPYMNLAREQACDVATLLLDGATSNSKAVAQAEELLRFAEDQFVVWAPIKHPNQWHKAMPTRRSNMKKWITPCVLEQYSCYGPVARSSAILINAYLKAYGVTGKDVYLEKARGLTNGLLKGQKWLAKNHHGNGEIPTWVQKTKPINWLNNSYYAADAVLNFAGAASKIQRVDSTSGDK